MTFALRPMIRCLALTMGLIGAVSAALAADNGKAVKGVVELFTSQGCSSCPPADAALKKLIDEGHVVALAYHVDYWNYLGWADTLASKENTARQYAYARMLGRNGVYTPQAILNGRDHMNGSDLQAIKSRLEAMGADGKGLAVPVDAAMGGDEISIKVGAGKGKANVVVVYFDRARVVNVERGENKGKQIAYWHAVRDVQTIGMWNGEPAEFTLPASVLIEGRGNSGCAVLLQSMKDKETPGAIIGAAAVLAGPQGKL
ncbi:MAG TPA: thioredoxin family protein [Sinorhizobium sp.]|nr:thioredoxin family protein [Sinorhizobium sp.]